VCVCVCVCVLSFCFELLACILSCRNKRILIAWLITGAVLAAFAVAQGGTYCGRVYHCARAPAGAVGVR